MKTSNLVGPIALLIVALAGSCKKNDAPAPDANTGLVGQRGNPRFNLTFTNQQNVDLDLYVKDPVGNIIFWNNKSSSSGGNLDVDCLCGNCPQGPTENIYWPIGTNTAPKGTYSYWVKYYKYCSAPASSQFTVKLLSGNKLIATQTGTLSSGSTQVWTYTQQ